MTKVLITGATGNVGTAVLRRFAKDSDVDLVGVVRRVPPLAEPYDRVAWHAVDVSDSSCAARLDTAMFGVDVVVHLAWAFQPTRDPGYLRRVGVDGSARVLAAAGRAGVAHVVHMSSVGAYRPRINSEPVDEQYPHTGMHTSVYSTHKAEAEAHLDAYESTHSDGMTITRVRPGIVLQRDAGAALSRYGLPAYLPTRLLRTLPILPFDRAFEVPVVHSNDLADAVASIVHRRAGGAFNIAAKTPLTMADVAAVLDTRPVHVPAHVLRSAVAVSWRLHLQPLSPDWLDLAFAVPLQDSRRARAELDWQPTVEPRAALAAAVTGMIDNASTASAAMRPRRVTERLQSFVTSGPISQRKQS